ncbi:unnamed protein product [marine sediment metagenome]|uniref:Uncharacterized protein n=1 Tax=marine sediment metagenome TaxID=412755 RepID=X1CHW0_9ZZZZ
MESLIDHIVSESDLDERTPERLILVHNGDYVELSGPLAYRRVLYAHNPDYSVFIEISNTLVEISDGETRVETLSEPATPVDGAEGRDLYLMAVEAPTPGEEGWLGMPTWVWWAAGAGGAALVLIGVVYAVTRK